MSREDYIEVSERIQAFYAKFPDGSLQAEHSWIDRQGEQWLLVKAYAYRTPDDPRPGIGHAWEPVPGRTPYTKDSELMVGETSAWGRALAALGVAVHRGVASQDEVKSAEARRATPTQPKAYPASNGRMVAPGNAPATEAQVKKLRYEMNRAHVNEILLNEFTSSQLGFEIPVDGIHKLTKHQASELIEAMTKQIYDQWGAPLQRTEPNTDPWVK